MSITLNTNTATSGTEILGRSLDRLARQTAQPTLADELTVSGKFDTQSQRAQSELGEVQTAVSSAQSADASLAKVSDLLSQMSALAQQADDASSQPKFKALQDQLQATLGSAAPAGGTPASVQALVGQDDGGNYKLSVSSTDVSERLDQAAGDVAEGRSGLSAGIAKLHHRAAALQIEHANLNATLANVQTSDDAAAATQLAKYALFSQPNAALSAQGAGRTAASAFKVLEE